MLTCPTAVPNIDHVMATPQALRINRRQIDNLKVRGRRWVEDNLELEKRMLARMDEQDRGPYELYVMALEKALQEFDNQDTL
jgi:hypothetical protein